MSLTDGRTLSEILSSGPYKIPAFQRDYSWKKPQILEFWNDAVDVFDSKESSYFFGPVVFIKNDKMSYHRVVDGQQRLTSVEILISVIRDIFESNDSVRLATIMQNFLYPITSIDHTDPILVLNENNNQFYKNVLLKPMDPDEKINQYKTKDPNELRLYENYKILYSKVKKKFLKSNKKGDKEENEKLFEFIRKILDSFKVYEIVVDSEDRAFRLFATLNQRGLDLGISDLVKNYIFMKSDKEHRDEFHGYWKKIIENLDDKNDLDDFLRHNWIASYDYVTLQSLYKVITEKIRSDKEVSSYLETLLEDSLIYNELVNGNRDDQTGDYLKSLFGELKNDSAQSVLINAHKFWKNNPKDIQILSKICLDVFFRGKTIGGKSPSEVGKCFAATANLIKIGKNLSEIKTELKKIDITDPDFQKSIQYDDHGSNIAKYLLKNIEIHTKSLDHSTKTISSTVTLEHIMPKTITNTDWSAENSKSFFNKNNHRKYLNRIGNLTLLHKVHNSELQNMSFDSKKMKYKTETDIDMTEKIADYPFWDMDEIEKRSENLSGDAVDIWSTLLDHEDVVERNSDNSD